MKESLLPGLQVVQVRTPTLPPATHTNTAIVGEDRLTVFDPASPYADQQQHLLQELTLRTQRGERVERIVLTHHHADHVSGAEALRSQLADLGHSVPILSHPVTAELVRPRIRVDAYWQDQEILDCGGRHITAHFTPGHAPGHLVFVDQEDRWVVAGDMVAGIGTILIDPDEGDLGLYLDSLQRMSDLDPSVLLPAHGPLLHQARAILAFYVAHRHGRSDQIRRSLDEHGALTPHELVSHVYAELDPRVHPIAARQLLSHLLWMAEHGVAEAQEDRWILR